jgi:hypothetical protein
MPASQAQQFDTIGVRGVLGFFFEALEQLDGQTWINRICNTFQSNQDTETYAGLGMVPQMREWIGSKKAQSFNEFSVKITNRDFEATLEVANKDRRRDKTGQLRARIGELAQRAVSHDAVLLSALIDGGQSTSISLPGGSKVTVQSYDGQALFSGSHKIGKTALSNLMSINLSSLQLGSSVGVGSPTNPSPAAIANVILQMLTQLYGFQDDQSQPMNEFAREFIVMVPVGLSGAAVQAVKGQFLSLGYQNPLVSAIAPSMGDLNFTVVPNPRLTKTDTLYLFRTDGTFKPLIRQVEMISPDSANEAGFGEEDGMAVGQGLIMKVLAEGSDYEFDNGAAKFSVEKSGFVGNGRFDQCVAAQMTQTAQ